MYPREFKPSFSRSFFLFGPRGVGKTTWVKNNMPYSVYIDLLDGEIYQKLSAAPYRIEEYIGDSKESWIVIDEIQRVPELLNEVHRLIEDKSLKFVLTGSSARKLRARGINLLAGRASRKELYPLTAKELGDDFNLGFAVSFGMLPSVWQEPDPQDYLKSYLLTYLREEVLQESLVRSLPLYSRFLEIASFSQGSPINFSAIARECGIDRKTVERYFEILRDLLIGVFIPPFTKRAKRRLSRSLKFYLFDNGLYRVCRPQGPFDKKEEVEGISLETLTLHHLRAANEYYGLNYEIYYWRAHTQQEVDFVLYGERGIKCFEVKHTAKLRENDFRGLKFFKKDYPEAKCFLIYCGRKRYFNDFVEVIPATEAFFNIKKILN